MGKKSGFDESSYRRVIDIGFYLLMVGGLALSVYTLYSLFVNIELLSYFVFVALPSGITIAVGFILMLYGMHLKFESDKKSRLG